MGAEKTENGELKSWKSFDSQDFVNRSLFTVKQDIKLLEQKADDIVILVIFLLTIFILIGNRLTFSWFLKSKSFILIGGNNFNTSVIVTHFLGRRLLHRL